jgi:hypothetical protein
MRFGWSWPTGGGRRQWVSLGPVGMILFVLFVMPFVLCVWLIYALVQVGVWAWREYVAYRG